MDQNPLSPKRVNKKFIPADTSVMQSDLTLLWMLASAG